MNLGLNAKATKSYQSQRDLGPDQEANHSKILNINHEIVFKKELNISNGNF